MWLAIIAKGEHPDSSHFMGSIDRQKHWFRRSFIGAPRTDHYFAPANATYQDNVP
jgi:hypothetical protein